MKITKFKAVKIPFATKKYYSSKTSKRSNKYKIWGYAYYIYDPLTGDIGKQFLQIEGGDYRPTDKEMLLTDYWKNMQNYSKKFREEFLTPFEIKNISKLDNKVESLNNLEIKKFNELSFEYFKRIKINLDLLTGSNSSGSKGDNRKVGIKYYDFLSNEPDKDEFHLHNFADFFNSLNKFKHIKLEETKLDDLEVINLKEYLDIFMDKQSNEKFNSARKVFKSFNYFVIDNIDESEEISKTINLICENKDNYKTYKYINKSLNNKNYIEKEINETIEDFKEELISEKKLKTKLRIRQKDLIRIEFSELKEKEIIEPNISSHLLKEYSGQDHSHIISVKKCFLDKDYYLIANKNNCLLIPGAFHKMITENQATFDPEGNLINRDLKIINNDIKISKIFLNKERVKLLEENYQNWIEYKENI